MDANELFVSIFILSNEVLALRFLNGAVVHKIHVQKGELALFRHMIQIDPIRVGTVHSLSCTLLLLITIKPDKVAIDPFVEPASRRALALVVVIHCFGKFAFCLVVWLSGTNFGRQFVTKLLLLSQVHVVWLLQYIMAV